MLFGPKFRYMATAAATVNNRQGTPDSFVGRPPLFQFTAFTIFVTDKFVTKLE